MEEEDTRDYSEPCVQCSVVNWGLTDEGRFYCKSCHNVIERTKEVLTSDVVPNTKIQSISRGFRKRKKIDKGWEWYVCEGFQYILKKQAEALQTLGVCPQMKISDISTDVDSEPERISIHGLSSFSESDGDLQTESSFGHVSSIGNASARETTSICSGSVDGGSYLLKRKKGNLRMSMPMTLSFCYIALLWLREPVTLSDLLRFVIDGHIPYLNAFQYFPEEMKLYGVDLKIFRVESWPVYEDVHNKMSELAAFLDLPCFPAITDSCFLHPNILCIKYLMEANLPDELHDWTCRVVKKIHVGETDFLTLDPVNKSARKVKYDVLAAAIIIVVLKLLFLLDDQYEWLNANFAGKRNQKNKEGCLWFDFKKWYKIMKKSVDVEQKKLDEERARCLWKCEKPLFYSAKEKSVVLKKRQMVVNLQRQFGALSGSMQVAEKQSPSSFQLNWAEENTDGNCFHGHILEGVLQEKGNSLTTMNTKYWLCTVKLCNEKICGHLTHYKESDFPQSYQFVLNLFSFLLRVPASLIHEEVCLIEHKLFKTKLHRK
ncbi:TATA box-binding protein-associated factor RNA polymerase I subunit B isoform X2 [Malaclemys terrapin pileata]|uniref:TATA box-binding protein-associated factor RNA polymerase I subunit B isoform X2 n=1 Tax=Malaclemys terrapin pileata TaxID=2991368 RepID=UPI0023A86374|nr:TATA box-binding protein-associated factor RNA polymerase I subunit B isoform X2 [Malaclemys terrapin pileata]